MQATRISGPGRYAFCSAPIPDLRTMVRMSRPTSYQELQTCLRRTLVADPTAEPKSEPGSGPAGEATPLSRPPDAMCVQWLTVHCLLVPAGGRTLVGASALPGLACTLAESLLRAGCRLPAGNRCPGWVMCCTCATPSLHPVAVPASCGGGLLGLLAPALLPLLLLVARRCSNSQRGAPRTPEAPRGRCSVCALRQTVRGGDPSTPTAAL